MNGRVVAHEEIGLPVRVANAACGYLERFESTGNLRRLLTHAHADGCIGTDSAGIVKRGDVPTSEVASEQVRCLLVAGLDANKTTGDRVVIRGRRPHIMSCG